MTLMENSTISKPVNTMTQWQIIGGTLIGRVKGKQYLQSVTVVRRFRGLFNTQWCETPTVIYRLRKPFKQGDYYGK